MDLPCVFLAHGKRVIFFLPTRNIFYSLHITCVTSYLNLVHFCICFLYLTKSFHFKQFFELSQIWTESDSKSRVKWVEKWNSCYLTQFETIPIKWKEISNILSMKHNHEHVSELFKNSKKSNEVWKSRDLSWCDGITRGCCDKKLRRLRTLYHDDVYKIETSHKKYMCDCILES